MALLSIYPENLMAGLVSSMNTTSSEISRLSFVFWERLSSLSVGPSSRSTSFLSSST